MMWISILLISILDVSGALAAEKYVSGVVGRAITIDCHYEVMYRSHKKYWCHGWTHQCSVLVETNGQHGRSGRVSITDNPEQRIFTVTMENLHSGDTGWYSCGITTAGVDTRSSVHLQVSDVPVSVPVIRYLSAANVSRLGGSVSVSCESLQGSLPIQYRWYEQTSSGHPKISDTNELALHCQSFNQQHHQYYCSASNWHGARSSAMVNVAVFNNGEICSYVTEINGTIPGALWAQDKVRGVVGRAITIDCHYAPMYCSRTKYLCHMWDRQCSSLVNTNGQTEQYGRMTIRDSTSLRIFTVTMENLVSRDTGLYRCGIVTSGNHPAFDIYVEISDEPVSVPLLRFSPQTNGSSCADSVSVSCESVHGSLPIQYSWYEKTPSVDSNISDTNKLDLHCQSIKYKNHLYYCKASNTEGEKSSEVVNVSISNSVSACRNVIEVNSMVSGAVWAEKYRRGVVGRAIAINCYYEAKYRSHTKYWCHGWTLQCSVLVETKGQHGRSGRVSITENLKQRIFTVTMVDLRSGDTGWYSCGITTPGLDPMFHVHLQVSDEPVSVPVLQVLSPANESCVGGSVSVDCESVQGSLPIQYSWYEKTSSVDSKISDTSKMDLHCQSFKHQHHQYYCSASNTRGVKSSEIVNVAVFNSTWDCSYQLQFSHTETKYSCVNNSGHSKITENSKDNYDKDNQSPYPERLPKVIMLSITGIVLMMIFTGLLLYLKCKNRDFKYNTSQRRGSNETRELASLEGSTIYTNLHQRQSKRAAALLANDDGGIMYSAVEFQRKSTVRHPVTNEKNAIYTNVDFQNNSPLDGGKAPSTGTLQDPKQTIYASVAP
ncbi:polymeric immunoglobulin receptor-like [Mobula birostris]|uniref:polymeric immunoglobulin receptor-like n=1 Tax=Mobula birostris TaxID=1983395 RepID=UPI003B27B6CE